MSEMNKLLSEIRDNLSQRSGSQKDEIRVMTALLNDKDYVVDVYGNTGKIAEYCPSEDARKMVSSIISSTAKISKDEANHLASEHEFTKSEATSMINIGKEFINTYASTGRKLPLGGRERSNVALLEEDGNTSIRFPKKIVDANGTVRYENTVKQVPEYKTIRSIGPCPTWLKK